MARGPTATVENPSWSLTDGITCRIGLGTLDDRPGGSGRSIFRRELYPGGFLEFQ
jgi:hypothetical protein